MFVSHTKCCLFIVPLLVLCLYKMETDVKSVSAVSYEFRNVNPCKLFSMVTYPDSVSTWFQWIKHFKSADQRPLGIGKSYHIFYDNHPMLFTVESYVPNSLIVLESESLLRPRVELRTTPVNERNTRLTISLMFRRSSALFQLSLGPFLRYVSKDNLVESVKRLKRMIKHEENICKMTNTQQYC